MTSNQAINHAIYAFNNSFRNSRCEEILEGLRKAKKDLKDLKDLKDTEKKLGFDLKLLSIDKAFVVKEDIGKSIIIEREVFFINPHKKEIAFGSSFKFTIYDIRDYGKTWARTKEELEKQ